MTELRMNGRRVGSHLLRRRVTFIIQKASGAARPFWQEHIATSAWFTPDQECVTSILTQCPLRPSSAGTSSAHSYGVDRSSHAGSYALPSPQTRTPLSWLTTTQVEIQTLAWPITTPLGPSRPPHDPQNPLRSI